MGRCCPRQTDPDTWQRKVGLVALWLFVAISSFTALTWYSSRASAERRRDHTFSAPQEHESHSLPRVALDRG